MELFLFLFDSLAAHKAYVQLILFTRTSQHTPCHTYEQQHCHLVDGTVPDTRGLLIRGEGQTGSTALMTAMNLLKAHLASITELE